MKIAEPIDLSDKNINAAGLPRTMLRQAWARFGARPAYVSAAVKWTYGDLANHSLRLAQLMVRNGVKPATPVFLWTGDADWLLIARLAGLECGATLAVFLPDTPLATVAGAAAMFKPALVLYRPELADAVARLREGNRALHTIAIEDAERMYTGIPAVHCDVEIDPATPTGIGFTSGTTGAPKVLSHGHASQFASLQMMLRVMVRSTDGTPERVLVGIPMMGAGSGMVLPTLADGGCIIRPPAHDARTIATQVAEHRATRLFVTPSQLIDLLDLPASEQLNCSSLRNIIYGTEWLPVAKLTEALRRFGPILQQGYGCAEVLPPVSMLQPKAHWVNGSPAPREVLSSGGQVVDGVDVRIADDDDNAVPDGTIGNVLVKSPTVFPGYWQRPDLNAVALRNGWYHTNDVGYFSPGGWLQILGRRADALQRDGRTIYARPIEEILHDHPAVKETAYVQVGEELVMAVSLRAAWRGAGDSKALTDELMAFVQARSAAGDAPDALRILDELPRSPLHKVLRREVREMLTRERAGA